MAVADRLKVEALLPHRTPFLFIDQFEFLSRVDGDEPKLVAHYQVPEIAFWTPCHFPENPIMPGALEIEMAFQAGALLATLISGKGFPVPKRLEKIDFKGFVKPGDCLTVSIKCIAQRGPVWKFDFNITNQHGKRVCFGKFTGGKLEQQG